jgi:hypothetical protein
MLNNIVLYMLSSGCASIGHCHSWFSGGEEMSWGGKQNETYYFPITSGIGGYLTLNSMFTFENRYLWNTSFTAPPKNLLLLHQNGGVHPNSTFFEQSC